MRVCSVCGLAAVPLLRGMCGGCYRAYYASESFAPATAAQRQQTREEWARSVRQRNGSEPPTRMARKLTADQVRKLRQEYNGKQRLEHGWWVKQARTLGVSEMTIRRAVQGEHYRWVQ